MDLVVRPYNNNRKVPPSSPQQVGRPASEVISIDEEIRCLAEPMFSIGFPHLF
jgi:hypothetical protein